ncbi:MAG: hypothetical protein ACE5JG_08515, partial [Planctomycetota bacterium]
MKAAVRGLTAGEEGYEKFPKILKKSFVFLNEYTTSVQAEHDPRGPEGPYRFQDRSVPVVVVKKWNGETILQQLGFNADATQAKRSLARIVERAVKKHGPIAPPKEIRKLLKSYDKGRAHLSKERTAAAIREFQAVLEQAQRKKKVFGAEVPTVVRDATERLKEIRERGTEALEEAAARAAQDAAAGRKEYRKLLRRYGGIEA